MSRTGNSSKSSRNEVETLHEKLTSSVRRAVMFLEKYDKEKQREMLNATYKKRTALEIAVEEGASEKLLRQMLDAGAKVDLETDEGVRIIQAATKKYGKDSKQLLLLAACSGGRPEEEEDQGEEPTQLMELDDAGAFEDHVMEFGMTADEEEAKAAKKWQSKDKRSLIQKAISFEKPDEAKAAAEAVLKLPGELPRGFQPPEDWIGFFDNILTDKMNKEEEERTLLEQRKAEGEAVAAARKKAEEQQALQQVIGELYDKLNTLGRGAFLHLELDGNSWDLAPHALYKLLEGTDTVSTVISVYLSFLAHKEKHVRCMPTDFSKHLLSGMLKELATWWEKDEPGTDDATHYYLVPVELADHVTLAVVDLTRLQKKKVTVHYIDSMNGRPPSKLEWRLNEYINTVLGGKGKISVTLGQILVPMQRGPDGGVHTMFYGRQFASVLARDPPKSHEVERKLPRGDERSIRLQRIRVFKLLWANMEVRHESNGRASPAPPPTALPSEAELQQMIERVAHERVQQLHAQHRDSLSALLEQMQSAQQQDLAALASQLAAGNSELRGEMERLVQSTVDSQQYRDSEARCEQQVAAQLQQQQQHLRDLDARMRAIVERVGQDAAKTDAMYTKFAAEQRVDAERVRLRQAPLVGTYYAATCKVLVSKLQSIILLGSGLFEAKAGGVAGAGKRAQKGVRAAAEHAAGLLPEAAELAASCVPLFGAVLGVMARRGCKKLSDVRVKQHERRVHAAACTTQDAYDVGELAARRCAQFFASIIEKYGAERFDDADMEKAGRESADVMFAAVTGGRFEALLDTIVDQVEKGSLVADALGVGDTVREAMDLAVQVASVGAAVADSAATSANSVGMEVTANALVLAVRQRAMKNRGVLRPKGGIFPLQLTAADVERLERQQAAARESDRQRRERDAAQQEADRRKLELLEAQMKVLGSGAMRNATPPSSPALAAQRLDDARAWTADHVASWMESIGGSAAECAKIVRREAIDGETLLDLTRDELAEVGITGFGLLKKIDMLK